MGAPHTAEQTVELATGVTTAYDTFGSPSDPALLLIAGLSCPMTFWRDDFCAMLAETGLRVVRFDNRDVGRATKLRELGHSRRGLVVSAVGRRGRAPYSISDMAADTVALLDALGIDRAHIAGQSMGGFIAQTIAIEHPERVLSLASVSSSTGSRRVGRTGAGAAAGFFRGNSGDEDGYVDAALRTWRAIGSPRYPAPDDEIAEQARAWYRRGYSASGVLRQLQAIIDQPDRSRDLAKIAAPTLVVHGTDDTMVGVSGGRATSRHIPGSELITLPGMGHDLPPVLWPHLVAAMARHAARAPRAA